MRKSLIVLTIVLGSLAGCKSNPAPPTINNAKQVWLNIHKQLGLDGDSKLVDIKKTDGQFAKINGVTVYTFFYEARERYLIQVGNRKPGDIRIIKSNYAFQKTENGWEGPDGEHFKD